MMRLTLAVALALAGCATDGPERNRPRTTNPSAVIAAELAFARLAQEKGQWTAFRATATDDAVMFAPQPVLAQQHLKSIKDPPVSVTWQPHEVFMSCDGSYGVTRGAWQRPNGVGYFTTIWQRQRDGGYKWVLDQGDMLTAPLPAPEMIAGKVAECAPPPPAPAEAEPDLVQRGSGSSPDRTLQWSTRVDRDCGRVVSVRVWNGRGYDEAIRSVVAAPPAAERPAEGC
jgi:hypothetical protein